jgi:hypothetical protein
MGLESLRSMTLLGQIQVHTVLILVESGSSHTFISNRVAAQMSEISVFQDSISVKIANGSVIRCKFPIF